MDYHLLFFTLTPSPSPSPLTPPPSAFDSILYRYIHEYEIALFWWAFRAAFYYLLVRELIYCALPVFLKSCKAYVESFFPASLVDTVEEDAVEMAEDILNEAMDDLSGAVDALKTGVAANPASKTPSGL
jgi:hypothetical protein